MGRNPLTLLLGGGLNLSDDRCAREHRYTIPSLAYVCQKIERLLSGNLTREEVSSWAEEYFIFDDPQIYPEVNDPQVHRCLVLLSGADLRSSASEYLHDENDFVNWLSELTAR